MVKLILRSPVFTNAFIELTPALVPVVLGRSRSADITINDSLLSRRHSEIRFGADGQFVIHDLDSTNLTIVNEKDIESHVLQHGDRILIGETVIAVEVLEPESDLSEQTTRDLSMLPPDETTGA